MKTIDVIPEHDAPPTHDHISERLSNAAKTADRVCCSSGAGGVAAPLLVCCDTQHTDPVLKAEY